MKKKKKSKKKSKKSKKKETEEKEEEEQYDSEDDGLGDDDYDLKDGFLVDDPEADDLDAMSRKRAPPVFDEDDPLSRPRKRLKLLAKKTEEEKGGFIVGEDESFDKPAEEDDFIVGDTDRKNVKLVDDIFGYSFTELIEYDKKKKFLEDQEDDGVDDGDDGDVDVVDLDYQKSPTAESSGSSIDKLKRLFSQEELQRKYLTKRDHEITKSDFPERIQVRGNYRVKNVKSEDLKKEAKWIYRRLHPLKLDDRKKKIGLIFDDDMDDFDDDWTLGKDRNKAPKDTDESGMISFGKEGVRQIKIIEDILSKILVERQEPPFIIHYRKDDYKPFLSEDEIWDVLDLDEQWVKMMHKKREIRENLRKLEDLNTSYKDLLEETNTMEELDDFVEFQKHFYRDSKSGNNNAPNNINQGIRKSRRRQVKNLQRKRALLYRTAKNNGQLKPFLKIFGLSSQEYAENIQQGFVMNTPVDTAKNPLQACEEYVSPDFPTPKQVLNAARNIFVFDITREPLIRHRVRGLYDCCATISTSETELGKHVNQPWFAEVRRISKTPVYVFESNEENQETLMSIFQAERDGLLKLTFNEIDDEEWGKVIDYDGLYYSDKSNAIVRKWNEERKKVIRDAKKMFHVIMEQHLRSKFLQICKSTIGKNIKHELISEKYLLSGPYVKDIPDVDDDGDEDLMGDRDMALEKITKHRILSSVAAADKNQDTVFVMLDENGVLVDTMKWMYTEDPPGVIEGRDEYRPAKDIKLQEDKFVEFVEKYAPDVVILAANTLTCIRTAFHIKHCLKRVEDEAVDEDEKLDIDFFFCSDKIAKVYAKSDAANSEFSGFSVRAKIAVSLGREFNCPLTEIARLVDENDSILSLKLHRLEDMMNREERMMWIERGFVEITNRVGVDLNRVLLNKHLRTTLQFVCGLGPRKARVICENISDILLKRVDLVDDRHVGKHVYNNCVAFLKVQAVKDLYDENEFFRLDRTRIHPDDYFLARKMCTDALEAPEPDDDEIEQQEKYIEEVMNNPGVLEDLDLEAYAIQLEEREGIKKKGVLMDSKEEFASPFRDPRNKHRRMDDVELFYSMIGETRESFSINTIVTAQVIRINDFSGDLLVRLDNRLIGHVEKYKVDRRVRVGQEIEGKISRVNFQRFSVDLDIREVAVRERKEEDDVSRLLVRRRKKKSRKELVRRNIDHPDFKNFDFNEATEFLRDKPVGDCVFRPSYSKGVNFLCVTFKFYEGMFVNLTIKEEGKMNPASLGKILKFERQTFSDLDEIFVTLVQDFVDFGESVVNHRRYLKNGTKTNVNNILKGLKRQNPKSIPWRMWIDKENPGAFYLSYNPGGKVLRTKFVIKTEGYHLLEDPDSGKIVGTIDALVDRFKRNYKQFGSYQRFQRMVDNRRNPGRGDAAREVERKDPVKIVIDEDKDVVMMDKPEEVVTMPQQPVASGPGVFKPQYNIIPDQDDEQEQDRMDLEDD